MCAFFVPVDCAKAQDIFTSPENRALLAKLNEVTSTGGITQKQFLWKKDKTYNQLWCHYFDDFFPREGEKKILFL